MGDNLRNLGNQINVPLHADEDGYFGRECPGRMPWLFRKFQSDLGTGTKGPAPCHCPYCGHAVDQNKFFTQDQIEYMQSVLLRKVTDAITKDLKSLEFEHKPSGLFWHRHQREGATVGPAPHPLLPGKEA